MKYAMALATVVAVASVATAAPNAEAERKVHINWCGIPGSTCWRKREAEAGPEAERKVHFNWCGIPGSTCWRKREAAAEADPEAKYHERKVHVNWCGIPGSTCWRKRSEEAGLAAGTFDADTDYPILTFTGEDNSTFVTSDPFGACGAPGEPCDMVKRAALAINDILKKHADADIEDRRGRPGSLCDRKHQELGAIADYALNGYDFVLEGESRAEALAGAGYAPEGSEEAELPSALIDYCDQPGAVCARARTAHPEKRELAKRCQRCHGKCNAGEKACHKFQHWAYRMNHPGKYHHPHPKPATRTTLIGSHLDHKPGTDWCAGLAVGSPCYKKRNASPEEQAEVSQPGGLEDTLVEIKGALAAIKRDAEEEKKVHAHDPEAKWRHCEKGRCSPITHAHLHAEKHNPDQAERAHRFAWGPYGPSSGAMPYFNELERRVDAAVDTLEE
ncbi:hypothetical protein BDY17DRAFT_326460 [Neohortaea acidophila]|uniref:Uncharacterized protein n=1 Tax=Neohortaea acidophila TaxID=245834 RepID=A0A6A6PKM2_9PEZI|nr:uncharacterized protein BDY17DRAFT_326460 [Neohortaea acidophila]KAF2480569.1 hypothetical protein BDY17DRAFT_326460 [Neohortaea acidophila]